jgi:hypothetical protein
MFSIVSLILKQQIEPKVILPIVYFGVDEFIAIRDNLAEIEATF